GHDTPYVRRFVSIVAASASKSTLRCGAIPNEASHPSRRRGKLPLSCWLMKTLLLPRACATAWVRRIIASSHVIAFQVPFSLTIGDRNRSGLYNPCNAD